jgi:hypothetical protein
MNCSKHHIECENKVRPFSSGTEAMMWLDHNCDRCVKSFKPKHSLPDFKTTQNLVNLGRECRLKYHIDMGFITGDIPEDIAKQVGWTLEKGFPESCMMYSDNDDDGWKPTPRHPDRSPDNQLCFPFILDQFEIKETSLTKESSLFLIGGQG